MSSELEQPSISEQFEQLLQADDANVLRAFLDDQNISDVAELIYEYPDDEDSDYLTCQLTVPLKFLKF